MQLGSSLKQREEPSTGDGDGTWTAEQEADRSVSDNAISDISKDAKEEDGSAEPSAEKSAYSESPIPDGGVRAWLQSVSGCMLYLNSW